MLSLAAHKKCIPKTGDISQAFCQSYLPDSETYVIKPPAGCPLTPKNLYLKLLKTLYGLRLSSRHWYETCKATLLAIGFKPCPNSPCLFVGHLLPNEAPIYLGLYVDNFIYFSKSSKVETHFETAFSDKLKVEFTPQFDYFSSCLYSLR